MKPITDIGTAPIGCTSPGMGRLLAAYEWGLLASPEEEAYEEHLVACQACAQELASSIRTGSVLRSRPAKRHMVLLPVGAAAAAAAVLVFSQFLGFGRSELAVSNPPIDTVAAPVQQATMTFELTVPSPTQFSYELQVPGTS
ncbi:hypothetical protein JXA88_09185 [Candidatus Fermentibacteria bacterium]|nr:hypothetical protein [Candidatus Fermentibacteria bacterium]